MPTEVVCPAPQVAGDGAGRARVSATLRVDGDEQSVWFEVPEGWVSAQPGEAFALAALLPAARVADRLVIAAPISARLFRNLVELQALFAWWFPEFHPIEVVAEEIVPGAGARRVGSFFSGGVDSFYVALTRTDVDTLIYVDGLDMIDPSDGFRSSVRSRIERAAEGLGRPLVTVATNVRTWGSPFTDWLLHSHVVALGSVAHALGGALGTALVPADHTYRDVFTRWGAHPLIAYRCSSDTTAIEPAGWTTPRVDRVREISGSKAAMTHLRVCWENPDEAYNCGRCKKCLRTMAALEIAGALDRCESFSNALDVDALAAIELGLTGVSYFIDSIPRAMEAGRPDLAEAMQQVVDRRHQKDRLEVLDETFSALVDAGEDGHEFVAAHRDALYATMSAHHGRWLVARSLRDMPGKVARKVQALAGRRRHRSRPVRSASLPELPESSIPSDADAIFLAAPGGNTGDDLIRKGAERFLEASGLSVWSSDGRLELAAIRDDLGGFAGPLASYRGDIIFTGGGNIGLYAENGHMRAKVISAARSARAILVLPQSARLAEPALTDPKVVVWARDRESKAVLEEAGVATWLVPDISFAAADLVPTQPDGEGTFFILREPGRCEEWLAPPVEVDSPTSDLTWRTTLAEVVATLEPYRMVVSNRLHGGIVSIMMRKRTAFLPVAYHKIRSFYDTWFAHDPGVAFIDSQHELERFRSQGESPASDLPALFWERAAAAMADFRARR